MKSVWELAADFIDPPGGAWKPQAHQFPPPGLWFGWLFLGGRGTGKTATDSKYVRDHIFGPPCDPNLPGGHWVGIIAPTKDDAVTSCVNGPSGLKQHDPGLKLRVGPGGTVVRFSNGAEAKLFGASTPEDVERLRSGGNRCLYWFEEMAAWRYINDCYAHARYGLRLGPKPHWVASTTPKPHLLLRYMVFRSKIDRHEGPGEPLHKEEKQKYAEVCQKLGYPTDFSPSPERERIMITKGTTEDNKHLPEHVRKMLYNDYSGTRLGRQELLAEILDEVEGALWSDQVISLWRLGLDLMPAFFNKIVVAVDPNVSNNNDECGIIVCGRVDLLRIPRINGVNTPFPELPHGFVLADYTTSGGPDKWKKTVIQARKDWGADLVVGEVNNGGDLVEMVLRTVDASVPFKKVHASRGKKKRAEPVATLYEQGRVHHVGEFPKLEDQMTTWDADDPPDDWSPDRMDAMVWGMTELLVGRTQTTTTRANDTRLVGRR